MSAAKAFIDSNVVLYLLSADATKADRAEAVVSSGAVISVQVLNEVTNVARRKLRLPWHETSEILALIRNLCPVEPLTVETHERGLSIAERYGLSVYDSMIIAAALLAGCDTLYSEDMQDGMIVEGRLRIRNPFNPG
jgi:predicted nucleic acid-binding protein